MASLYGRAAPRLQQVGDAVLGGVVARLLREEEEHGEAERLDVVLVLREDSLRRLHRLRRAGRVCVRMYVCAQRVSTRRTLSLSLRLSLSLTWSQSPIAMSTENFSTSAGRNQA